MHFKIEHLGIYFCFFCEFRLKYCHLNLWRQYFNNIEWIFCTQNPWTAILPLPVFTFNMGISGPPTRPVWSGVYGRTTTMSPGWVWGPMTPSLHWFYQLALFIIIIILLDIYKAHIPTMHGAQGTPTSTPALLGSRFQRSQHSRNSFLPVPI